jgi:hypothetical protein
VTGRQRFEIVCPLGGSGAVHRPARVEYVLEMGGLRDVFRALKHHVLEQMGKTGATFFFVTRANVVIDCYGDNRNRVVFAKNNAKTIGKGELFDGGRCQLETFGHFNLDSSEFV